MGMIDRYLRIHMISAEPENLLSKLLFADLELQDVRYIDLLTVEVRIRKNQYSRMQEVLDRAGATYHIVRKEGVLWCLQNVGKRPVLIAGALFFLLLSGILPGRIFFVRVVGNEWIPDNLILSQAESCGIGFGTKAVAVRSENVKNMLLAKLPQLQWVGITTEGSVATIQVKERSATQGDIPVQGRTVSSIVAARDGTITQMTVYRGNPLFQVGQSVKKGDVLVSGYTDCGIKLRAEQAQAEVFAYTMRENQFLAPDPTSRRETMSGEHTCIKIRIGKKVINLCNHSGILDATCVKMYSEEHWTLPGGFALPVTIIKVKHQFYHCGETEDMQETVRTWLPQFALEYVQDQMIAGKILDQKLQWDFADTGCVLYGEYDCHEMIGQVKYEEITEENAEDNGKNDQR